MFLRKLTVIVMPLLLCALVCLILPLTESMGFFSRVLSGLALGVALALLLPLSGAVKRREPFGGLLWAPAAVLTALVVYQYLLMTGTVSALTMLAPQQPNAVLAECAFIGFMAVTMIRTKA